MNSRVLPRCIAPVCAFAFIFITAGTASAVTYTFDGLSTGSILGQDNWTAAGSGGNFQIVAGAGFDTSLVLKNPGVNAVNFNVRQNNGTFSFGSFTGTETNAVLEFDVRVNSSPGENQNVAFYLGDLNGSVSQSAQIQYSNTNSGVNPSFFVRKANHGSSLSAAIPGSVTFGDWVRVRLTMDFTANSGDGLGSVTMADLTQSTGYTAVSGLQNLALGMSAVGVNATVWNTIWMRSDLSSNMTADNLTVVVPEPVSLGLLLLGATFLGVRRRRS